MTQDGFPDFLDDYFAECEEHLTGVRGLLLALEGSVGREINRGLLDELFRHFHSLKGISGMVEVRQAEDLAHRLEEYLRVLRKGDAILSTEGMDALFDGTQLRLVQVTGVVRQEPAATRTVVVRVDRQQGVRSERGRPLGEVNGVPGVVGADAGHDRAPPAHLLDRQADHPELLLVGQRGCLAGRSADHEPIGAVSGEMVHEAHRGFLVDAP